MNKYHFSIIVESDADGYFAYCPELQGCYSQGESYEEVITNIKDVIKLHIADRLEEKEVILQDRMISLANIEVAV